MNKCILSAALKTGKGCVRKNNEDAYYFNGNYAEIADMDLETTRSAFFQDNQALFAICDGMGGHESGEIAAYTAVSRMPQLQQELLSLDFSGALWQWVDATNTAIHETAGEGGCTLAILYYRSGMIHIAHIGDSRIYRLQNGKLSRMTKDHSMLQVMLDAGIITGKEAETHPQRHVITRALGFSQDESDKTFPDIREPIRVKTGDRYLICSDGITDMLSDSRIESFMSQGKNAMDCTERIYQEALNAGGRDNLSAIVIEITEGESGQAEKEAPEQQNPEQIHIEHLTTIRQTNGQQVIVRTQITTKPNESEQAHAAR